MVENAPAKRLKHGEITIEGYSRAAVQSYWRIAELKMGFDLGAQPWDFMGTPTWFISHTHLDHIAALPLYIARRRMMKMPPPVIYLPGHSLDPVNQMLRAFTRLDRGGMPCELIGVEPGDELDLSREHVVDVIKTKHTVPSVGYIVSEKRRKLKTEYKDLSGEQIRDLRISGKEVTDEQRIAILGFTGDTSPKGLDDNPELYQVQVLITEMTFVSNDHRKEKIHKNGHMHLDDFVERKDRFENELIIASHFSTRYTGRQIRRMVEKRLPGLLGERLHLWI